VHEILSAIIARNRTYEKPFFVFYQPLIHHDFPIIKIQSWWRGTILRSRKNKVFVNGRSVGIPHAFTV